MNHKVIIQCFAVCFFILSAQQCLAANDTVLPDGTTFQFWEQPVQFSHTYYVDCNSPNCDDNGPGTKEKPFRTISKAAEILQPGERVVIESGIYRECVRPARGGTDPNHIISYEAAPGAKVFIKGSDTLNDGWQPGTTSSRGRGGNADGPVSVWKHQLTGGYVPRRLQSIQFAQHCR